MGLNTVAINFKPNDILKKYKPLRKISVPLNFELIYYPYFLVSTRSVLKAKLVKERIIIEKRVVSGITSSISKIHGVPELTEGVVDLDTYSCTVFKPIISSSSASELTEKQIKAEINKKFGHPFRPKLNFETETSEIFELYKPFWVISGTNIEEKNGVMVVDGVTGIAGVPEASSIKSIWLKRKLPELCGTY